MLTLSELSAALYAIATEYPERALNVLQTAELTEDIRIDLVDIVSARQSREQTAVRMGDRLHDAGADAALVNECYRSAFYFGDQWQELLDNPIFNYISANRSAGVLDKWVHYLPIYHRHLAPFRGRPVKVLEIGVYRGGGLRMLRHYLGAQATIVGLDVDELAQKAAGSSFDVVLGDQSSAEVLAKINDDHGPFDIIIDDGGHTMEQQITTATTLFPLLSDGGVFIVEDCHTSYWESFGGGLHQPGTFIEWAKARVDDLHSTHAPALDHYSQWATHVDGIHFYDSVVVLDKKRRWRPFNEVSGSSSFIMTDRVGEQIAQELVGSRAGAVAELEAARSEIAELREIALGDPTGARQDELRLARAELRKLRDETVEISQRLESVDAERDLLQGQLLEAWGQLNSMRKTVSWRVTGPLRFVRRGGR